MLSSFSLKVIALVTMIIDHTGMVFFKNQIWFRYIGRISFPIYAFLLTTGFIFTRSRKKYAMRLLAFAFISEIPYDYGLYSGFSWAHQNIMFTLLCALLILWCIDNVISGKLLYVRVLSAVAVVPLILSSAWFNFSYGVYGVMLPVFYYIFIKWNPLSKLSSLFERRYPLAAVSGSVCTYIFYGIKSFSIKAAGRTIKLLSMNKTQLYACYSAIPLILYNGKRGKYKLKWFFYLSYPVHIGIIYFLKTFVIK